MKLERFPPWAAVAIAALLLAVPAGPARSAASLDNATCLDCHDGSKTVEAAVDGESRKLNSVAPDAFAKSVHAKMSCVACHTDITDNAETGNEHRKDAAAKPADCATCHKQLWETAQKEGRAKERPRLGVVAANAEEYKASYHARPDADDPTRPKAGCDDCHSSHSFAVPPQDSPQHAEWRLGISESCGTSCHEEALETYTESVHGKEVREKRNAKGAVCSDCHTAHSVGNTSALPFKVSITAGCGDCHEKQYETYKATYHGQINTLGYGNTAKCYDCHGSHGILDTSDPQSSVHPDNRLETCRECHSGKKEIELAPEGYASFFPHGDPWDFERYPQMWIANQLMIQLLVGTFGFFWLHTILWFYREYRDRRQGKARAHVTREAVPEIPERLRGKHFRRFSATWRLAHITFALSLMILTLTGIPLFYPEAPWAKPLMRALGGPESAGLIHRVNAVIFAAVFFWHLAYVLIRIAANWKSFRLFGPNSLIPNLKDGRDFIGMVKWFFGKGPRPLFERWTYWEKFDYWAPFWGVTIIGVSGLMMWMSNTTGSYLPGWVFNVAAIFHSEEAFLAVVFLFTVHFFNNHFRPDKFPVEIVMFTGSMPLDEYRHEHALEYRRLLESGELDTHVVDAPSPARTSASRALGFALIAAGLTLLALVAIGFFGIGVR